MSGWIRLPIIRVRINTDGKIEPEVDTKVGQPKLPEHSPDQRKVWIEVILDSGPTWEVHWMSPIEQQSYREEHPYTTMRNDPPSGWEQPSQSTDTQPPPEAPKTSEQPPSRPPETPKKPTDAKGAQPGAPGQWTDPETGKAVEVGPDGARISFFDPDSAFNPNTGKSYVKDKDGIWKEKDTGKTVPLIPLNTKLDPAKPKTATHPDTKKTYIQADNAQPPQQQALPGGTPPPAPISAIEEQRQMFIRQLAESLQLHQTLRDKLPGLQSDADRLQGDFEREKRAIGAEAFNSDTHKAALAAQEALEDLEKELENNARVIEQKREWLQTSDPRDVKQSSGPKQQSDSQKSVGIPLSPEQQAAYDAMQGKVEKLRKDASAENARFHSMEADSKVSAKELEEERLKNSRATAQWLHALEDLNQFYFEIQRKGVDTKVQQPQLPKNEVFTPQPGQQASPIGTTPLTTIYPMVKAQEQAQLQGKSAIATPEVTLMIGYNPLPIPGTGSKDIDTGASKNPAQGNVQRTGKVEISEDDRKLFGIPSYELGKSYGFEYRLKDYKGVVARTTGGQGADYKAPSGIDMQPWDFHIGQESYRRIGFEFPYGTYRESFVRGTYVMDFCFEKKPAPPNAEAVFLGVTGNELPGTALRLGTGARGLGGSGAR